jgi:hypothetical protein
VVNHTTCIACYVRSSTAGGGDGAVPVLTFPKTERYHCRGSPAAAGTPAQLRHRAPAAMMEPEEEARVSLDEDMSDGSRSSGTVARGGDVKSAGRRARHQHHTRDERRADAKRKRRRKPVWGRLFGLRHPLVGGETWESVATSWLLPDPVYTAWRCTSVLMVIAVYATLAVTRSLSFQYYTTDVFLCVLVSSSLLLLPNLAILIAGPHEDELDTHRLRWVWTLIAAFYQITVTNVVFIAMAYWVFFDVSGTANNGGLDTLSQALLHASALLSTGGELALGCIELRAAYAAAGAAALGLYLTAVVGGHHAATGQWLWKFLQRDTLGKVVSAHLAVGVIYLLAIALVLAAERGRRTLARCVERSRYADG